MPLTACTKNTFVINNKVFCFDTFVDITLYEGNEENSQTIEQYCNLYDKLADNYQARDLANIYSINQSNEDISVSNELYDLLKTSFNVSNEGAEYFNPLCGSLAKKWKESLKNQQILDENVINEELNKIKNSSLLFKENGVVQRVGEAEIDLGGITKGYVLDKTLEYLNNQNIKQYLINGGSSSILLGEKNTVDGLFKVGLNDLNKAYLKLKNCFVSTSSKSVQGVTINGVTYSHIINPKTGSAINENDAVIVISDKGYYGDAMSTSLMMNTVDEIKEIEKEHNIKTVVIKNNKVIYANPNVEVFYR